MPDVKLQRRGAVYTPFRSAIAKDMADLRSRVGRFFDEPFGKFFAEPLNADLLAQPIGWYPAMDVMELDDEFVVTAELPGIKKSEVEVSFEDGMLTIRGEKKEEEKKEDEESNGRRFYLFERSYGTFQRTFTLPFVDAEKVKAEFNDGLLTIHLPKLPELKTRGRKIEIANKS